MKRDIKKAISKSCYSFGEFLPILLGVLMLISLAITAIPKEVYSHLFKGNYLLDPIIGSALGSVFAGNPITSYIIGGELLNQGVSLVAVTAFIVAWVTVGIAQLPAEMLIFGKKFAIVRNLLSFLFSILIAIIAAIILCVV